MKGQGRRSQGTVTASRDAVRSLPYSGTPDHPVGANKTWLRIGRYSAKKRLQKIMWAPALPLRASHHVPRGLPLELTKIVINGAVVVETVIRRVQSTALDETHLMSTKAAPPEEDEK